MTQHRQNLSWNPARLARGLVMAGAVGAAGCGEPGQGSAKVAPETRQQLAPHVDSNAKGRKLQAVAGKSFSIKDRAPAAPSK